MEPIEFIDLHGIRDFVLTLRLDAAFPALRRQSLGSAISLWMGVSSVAAVLARDQTAVANNQRGQRSPRDQRSAVEAWR